MIPDGKAVIYNEVSGKPVGGLVDGHTYYAYAVENPHFDENFPQYVLGLRHAADTNTNFIDLELSQSLTAGNASYRILGVDTNAGVLAAALPLQAEITAHDDALAGGSATVADVPTGSLQAFNEATGGTFTVVIPTGNGDDTVSTAPLAFDATPDAIKDAINQAAIGAGLDGIEVTGGYGLGTRESPWTLVGTGLDAITFDDDNLVASPGILSRLSQEDHTRVHTTATGGTFTLTVTTDDGFMATTDPIAFDATADEVREALMAIDGVWVDTLMGSGTPDDPWLMTVHRQSLKTGDAVVFKDGWGATSYGLVDGRTYYVVTTPEMNGKNGAVILALAETEADAKAAEPKTLPLISALTFSAPDLSFPSGTVHTVSSPYEGTGIDITATLLLRLAVDEIGQRQRAQAQGSADTR
jgi:hypothetical protein